MAHLLTKTILGVGALLALGLLLATATQYGQVTTLPRASFCTLRLYSSLPEDARVVVIGSSRVREGIEPDVLSKVLGLSPTSVINLGHSTESLPLDVSIMRRLLQTANPQVLIFGLVPRGEILRQVERKIDPRKSAPFDFKLGPGTLKQRYLLAAPISDQIHMLRETIDNPILFAWESSRLFAERIRQFIPAVLEKRTLFRPFRQRGTYDPDRVQDCRKKKSVEPDDVAQKKTQKASALKQAYLEQFADFTDPDPLGYLSDADRRLQHAAIRKLVEMASAAGATPAFLYIPGIDVPVSPELGRAFEAKFGAPLWMPDADLRARLQDEGYFDNSHLNNQGRKQLSHWLAQKVRPLLSKGIQ